MPSERSAFVRRHLHPGPDLRQRARLLVDRDFDAAPVERQRRSEPGDAAADNRDPRRTVHSSTLLVYIGRAGGHRD